MAIDIFECSYYQGFQPVLVAPTAIFRIMILEGEGKGGNTATEEFFDVLSADFERLDAETLALNEHHRTFPGLHDWWQILRKK